MEDKVWASQKSPLCQVSLAVCRLGEVQVNTCPHTESRNQAHRDRKRSSAQRQGPAVAPALPLNHSRPAPLRPSCHRLAQGLNLGTKVGGEEGVPSTDSP